MKKASSKRKVLMIVATIILEVFAISIVRAIAVSVLSIGLFNASSFGISQFTFAAESDYTILKTELEQPIVELESESIQLDQPELELDTEIFLTSSLEDQEGFNTVPTSAISRMDAKQIAALYISDMFGTCVDGLYMPIWHDNSWWVGNVSTPEFKYRFTINRYTGQRIDLSQTPLSKQRNARWSEEQREDTRNAVAAVGWNYMSRRDQVAFAGISSEVFEAKQTAKEFAQQHFNQSVVTDIYLSWLVDAYVNETGGVNVEGFRFTAIDDTGRDAIINIFTEESQMADYISISTWHNDYPSRGRF